LPCADGAEERRLIAQAKQGCPKALAALYQRHRSGVYDLAFALTGNHEDAEDLRQTTFVRAFLGLRKFRGQSALRTWLYHICLNLARSSGRQRRAAACKPEMDDLKAQNDPSLEAHRRMTAEEIRRRIATLPRWAAQVVALCDLQGLSYREAAEVLGCSPKGIGPGSLAPASCSGKDSATFCERW